MLKGWNYEVVPNFTSHELYRATTMEHPLGIYIPGHEMTMGLLGNILSLCKGPEFIIWDGACWLAPAGILFSRLEDYNVMVSFLREWKVNHDVVHHKGGWGKDLQWESLVAKMQAGQQKETVQ